jgi:hypothetical protein
VSSPLRSARLPRKSGLLTGARIVSVVAQYTTVLRYPSVSGIAMVTGMSEDHIRRACKLLVAAGILTTETIKNPRQRASGGPPKVCLYRLSPLSNGTLPTVASGALPTSTTPRRDP